MKDALADAIFVALKADSNLAAIVGARIYDLAGVPRAAELTFPYVVVGERTGGAGTGVMQREIQSVRVTVHVWSQARGMAECGSIQTRMRRILERANLALTGYTLISGSLLCGPDDELAFADVDEDMPEKSLVHGVQQWRADVEDVAP